jgi:hypothetical protein
VTDRERLLAAYERAWVHHEEPGIRAELEACWTPDSTYVSPLTDVVRGVEGLVNLILDFPVMFPGARMEHTSQPDVHHDVAYFTWRLTSTTRIRMLGRDHGLAVDGVDFVEFDPAGAIRRITAFFGVQQHLTKHAKGERLNGSAARPADPSPVLDLERTERLSQYS